MKPHELIHALVERDGGSLPVAKKMGKASFQPTLYRFISGETTSPTRKTAERIAKYYRIPVDALYNDSLATEAAARLLAPLERKSDWTPDQHATAGPAAGVVVAPLAQELSDPKLDDEPQQHTWEFILSAAVNALSKRFVAAVPDGALAPTTPKGTEYLFAAPPTGHPRDSVVVIVQAASGRRYMRLFFALDGGAWEARARDPAFPSLHSERDGLQLLAVAIMRPGGEG